MRSEHEKMKLVPTVTFREMFTNEALRIPLIIAIVVMIGQQLSGINAVRMPVNLYYYPKKINNYIINR